MKYKRSYSREIVGIIVAVVVAIMMMSGLNPLSGSRSNSLNLNEEEAKLSENPVTATQMETISNIHGLDSGGADETPEEKQERYQRTADLYNSRLKSEQESIRSEQERRKEDYNKMMRPVLFSLGAFIVFSVIYVILKFRQPHALSLSDDTVSIKRSVFHDMKQFDLTTIRKIEYKIRTRYDSENRRHRSRILYFMDAEGNVLEKLNLDELSGVYFNQIQQDISQRAPHIEWIYPR